MARDLSALLAFLFLAGLCPSASAQGSAKSNEITKTEGDSVTFQADYSGPRDEVTWKIGADKLVEVEENYSKYYRLEDRASASFSGGNLTIRDLVESDSRDYSAHVLNKGEYHETKFILKVSPSKPSINCTFHDKFFTLSCNSSSKVATYKLSNSTHVLSWGSAVNVSREGLNTNESYHCTVNNSHAEIESNRTICKAPPTGNLAAILVPVFVIPPVITGLFLCWKKSSQKRKANIPDATGDSGNPAEIKRLKPDDAAAGASNNSGNAEG